MILRKKPISEKQELNNQLREQGNLINEWLFRLYENYYDTYDNIEVYDEYDNVIGVEKSPCIKKETYEKIVQPIVVDYVKNNFPLFYENHIKDGEKWMITIIERKWY